MAMEGSSAPVPERRLKELAPGAGPVEVVGRVVQFTRREVTRRSDGQRRPLVSGLLSDGTATVRFTWWDPPSEGVDRGTVLRAAGAEVVEFRGRPELSFTWRTKVGPASAVELPKVDAEEIPLRPVVELRPSEETFRTEARVVRVASRPVSVGQERRVVHEGLLADTSGAIAFSAWSDFSLVAGEAVRIAGGYVRSFRGEDSSAGRISICRVNAGRPARATETRRGRHLAGAARRRQA